MKTQHQKFRIDSPAVNVFDEIAARHAHIRKLISAVDNALSGHAKTRALSALKADIWIHHKTEEACLYAPLIDQGLLPASTSAAKEDHLRINRLLTKLESTGLPDNRWTQLFQTLSDLLDQHMRKEETVFLPSVEQQLSAETAIEIGRKLAARYRIVRAALSPVDLDLAESA